MFKPIRWSPMVALVAVLALALGSFGTATAAGISAKQVKKIAAKVVKQRAPGLSVAHAVSADSASGVPNNAINSADILDGTIVAADLAPGRSPPSGGLWSTRRTTRSWPSPAASRSPRSMARVST